MLVCLCGDVDLLECMSVDSLPPVCTCGHTIPSLLHQPYTTGCGAICGAEYITVVVVVVLVVVVVVVVVVVLVVVSSSKHSDSQSISCPQMESLVFPAWYCMSSGTSAPQIVRNIESTNMQFMPSLTLVFCDGPL